MTDEFIDFTDDELDRELKQLMSARAAGFADAYGMAASSASQHRYSAVVARQRAIRAEIERRCSH